MSGLYYEDFELGTRYISKGRTVTESDIVNFAGISGDYNPLHVDDQFAKNTIFGRRVAHGVLGIALMTGLNQSLGITTGTMHAFLGLENWDFLHPIFIGDTLHLELEVASKRETKKSDRGIVNFTCELINQHGEVVQRGLRKMLMKQKKIDSAKS